MSIAIVVSSWKRTFAGNFLVCIKDGQKTSAEDNVCKSHGNENDR